MNNDEELAKFNNRASEDWVEQLTREGYQVYMIIGMNSKHILKLATLPPDQLPRKTVRQMLKNLYKNI